MNYSFGWRDQGLLSIWKDSAPYYALHIIPAKQYRSWGRADNRLFSFKRVIIWGMGPIFTLVKEVSPFY